MMKGVRRGVPSRTLFATQCDWRNINAASTGLDAAYIITRGDHPRLDHQIRRLAKEMDTVVALCSETPKVESQNSAISVSFLQLDGRWLENTPKFAHAPSCREALIRNFSIPYKRNFAISHARLNKFRYILLIDDDIIFREGIGRRARATLINGAAAYGTYSLYHPDKSITDLWLHKESGLAPVVAISGNCIALDVGRPLSFFPEVYNEDWLFFQALIELQGGKIVGGENVVQLPPRPKSLEQAKFQQFGEVLAGCLITPASENGPSLFDLASKPHAEQILHEREFSLRSLETKWDGLDDVLDEIKSISAEQIVDFSSEFIEKNASAW